MDSACLLLTLGRRFRCCERRPRFLLVTFDTKNTGTTLEEKKRGGVGRGEN